MNIVRTVFNKKALTALFVLGGSYGGMRYALSSERVFGIYDQRLDLDVQRSLKKVLEQAPLSSAAVMRSELQKECPAVAAVSIERKASGVAQVLVKASVPQVKLVSSFAGFKEYCLCSDGVIVEKKYFAQQVVEGMAVITIDGSDFEEKIQHPALIDCALQLKTAIFAEFDVIWRSKSEILLRSAELLIIADDVTVHDQERMGYVKRILAADGNKYKNGMKADIRLRDSLVCSDLGKHE